jgi:copper(I)-binding protein
MLVLGDWSKEIDGAKARIRAMTHAVIVVLLAACAAQPAATAEPRVFYDAQRDPGQTLRVVDAWSRPTLAAGEHTGHGETSGAGSGTVYLTIVNTGAPDTLTSVSGADAGAYELHESRDVNGLMRMDALPDGVPIPAGATVTLSPGGKHIMLRDLTRRFREGDAFVITLTFKSGRIITPEVRVRGL